MAPGVYTATFGTLAYMITGQMGNIIGYQLRAVQALVPMLPAIDQLWGITRVGINVLQLVVEVIRRILK